MENTATYKQTVSLSAATNLYDLSMLEEMDDNEYLLEILTILLSETTSDFKEMKHALQQDRVETVCKKAHKIKGSASVIQAEKLASLVADIEDMGKKGVINDELISLVEKAAQEYCSIEKELKIYVEGIK
jgi:HPt (histidine-containing phosphotransfer) domain-containing protein